MNLIVVDIQPSYKNHISFSVTELLNNIKEEDYDNILWLFNGPDMGFEDSDEINWWLSNKIEDEEDEYFFDFFSDIVNYYEKGYGFFRDLMGNVDDDKIIEIGKYMIKKNLNDMRELNEEDIKYLINKGIEEEYLNGDNHFFAIPDVKDELDYLRGKEIIMIGGGEYECLLEIELLMKMLEIPYKIDNSYVY